MAKLNKVGALNINFINFIIYINLLIGNKMLNYKSSMLSSKKYLEDDMPTAYKTNYQPNSPSRLQINTPKNRSITKYSNRIVDAKNNIQEMLTQMGHKATTQKEAIGRVHNTKHEVMNFVREMPTNTPKQGSPKLDLSTNYSPRSADHMQASYQMPQHLQSQNNFMPAMPANQQNNLHFNNRSNQMSMEQENLQLRRALNEQIRENNALLIRIQYLERENQQLRNMLYTYSGGKINMMPAQYTRGQFNPEENNHYEEQQMPKTAKFSKINEPENVRPEPGFNMSMPMPFTATSPRGMAASFNNERQLHMNMFRQLQELKDQNERLRQNTISVLKNSC